MIYDTKELIKCSCLMLAVVALMYLTKGTGFIIVLPIAFGAFFKRKPEEVLFWAAVAIAMVMGNPLLMPKSSLFMLFQRIMLMGFGVLMILQMTTSRSAPTISPFLLLLPYLVFSILPSAMGFAPLISFLKLILFFVIYMAYFGIANQVATQSRSNLPKLRAMILAIVAFFIVGSVLLFPFPAIGQMKGSDYLLAIQNGQIITSLFMGVVNHSQALGPMIAMLTIFVLADWVLAVRKFSWLHAFLFVLGPMLIYKTSSRTAMGGFLAGLLCLSYCIMRERGVGVRWRGKVKVVLMSFFVVCAIAVVSVPAVRERIVKYTLKFQSQASYQGFDLEKTLASRQGLIDNALMNFKKSPVIGNGFQVADYTAHQKVKTWKDLITSPIEKGVWVVAILEEAGVVGMMLLCGFLCSASYLLLTRRAYIGLSQLIMFFILNLGEFSMFSMSNIGGFCWMFIFIGAAFDELRLRDDYIKRSYGDYS